MKNQKQGFWALISLTWVLSDLLATPVLKRSFYNSLNSKGKKVGFLFVE
ncbi:hypothetical protein SBF1_1660024 [Candidatus Desulfosporosinus infrequens]|uniref:Uncharacterized protein n=1 Tax=Candidatus Desulfosporosinus infrequens TaxID=2043169 RepID=A0A2U3KAP6_9FIRM|nr:hypothetical protein SBF1_1660024 [Candidatus Desulfosporosinus infrequens]